MSVLANVIAELESSGGSLAGINAINNPTMVDTTYGQYQPFVNQYGSGAAGVENYATQVLQYNPNATLGDFYASYYGGTGNPASLSSFSNLPASVQSNFNNNAGFSASTPLSSLLGSSPSSVAGTTGGTSGNTSSGGGGIAGALDGITSGFENWLGQIGGSVVFVVIGVVLLGGALIIFAQNEGVDTKVAAIAGLVK